MEQELEVGQIVYSKAGRDSGKYFAVIEKAPDGRVKIADGDLRRIKKAKLKNVKHLVATGGSLQKIADKLNNGQQVFDAELFSALRYYEANK